MQVEFLSSNCLLLQFHVFFGTATKFTSHTHKYDIFPRAIKKYKYPIPTGDQTNKYYANVWQWSKTWNTTLIIQDEGMRLSFCGF